MSDYTKKVLTFWDCVLMAALVVQSVVYTTWFNYLHTTIRQLEQEQYEMFDLIQEMNQQAARPVGSVSLD